MKVSRPRKKLKTPNRRAQAAPATMVHEKRCPLSPDYPYSRYGDEKCTCEAAPASTPAPKEHVEYDSAGYPHKVQQRGEVAIPDTPAPREELIYLATPYSHPDVAVMERRKGLEIPITVEERPYWVWENVEGAILHTDNRDRRAASPVERAGCPIHPNGCPAPTADSIDAIRDALGRFDAGGADAEQAMLMLEALAPMMARQLVALAVERAGETRISAIKLCNHLCWALEVMTKHETRLIMLGDSPDLVRSEPHVRRKTAARDLLEAAWQELNENSICSHCREGNIPIDGWHSYIGCVEGDDHVPCLQYRAAAPERKD